MPKKILTEDMVVQLLKKKTLTVVELASRLKSDTSEVKRILRELRTGHTNLVSNKGHYHIDCAPKPDKKSKFVFDTSETHTFKFGVCTDQHLCSKYERLDILNTIYDVFELEGVTCVFNCGNYIDGFISRINGRDVNGRITLPDQVDYLVEHYPQRDGIKNYIVSGDDHEGWFAKDTGFDVGAYTERCMLDAGRNDWVNLGYMESTVGLRNLYSRKRASIMAMHPGGGSAYAISYKPQKIVESFSGGEKPDVLLLGHYHKSSYNRIRGIRVWQGGCVQDQTPFMRKNKISAHIGAWIIELRQNPKTGQIVAAKMEELSFSIRSSSNNRWNYEGRIDAADYDSQ